jgi:hypothetical protein
VWQAERELIKQRLEEDRRDRATQLALTNPNTSAASAAASAAAASITPNGAAALAASAVAAAAAMSSAAGPSDESDPNPDESTTLRVRCEDGHVLWLTLRACDPLSAVAAAVLVHRGAEAGPFALRVPFPPVECTSHARPHTVPFRMRRV